MNFSRIFLFALSIVIPQYLLAQIPTVPQNLQVSNLSDSGFDLTWDESSDDGEVAYYKVFLDGEEYSQPEGNSETISGLSPDSPHTVSVSAVDNDGNESAQSTPLDVSTLPDETAPDAPSGLVADASTVTTIDISWTASADNVGVVSYNIYLDGDVTPVTNVPGTTATLMDLTPNTTYNITVSALDAEGNESAQSAPLDVSTLPDETAPDTPTGLVVDASTVTTIEISWTASSDDVGVVSYNIYVDGNVTPVENVAGTTATLVGLTPNTSYNITVSALDAAGNESAQSSALPAQTEADNSAPDAPTNLAEGTITETTIDLTWDEPFDNVAVTGYNVYIGPDLNANVAVNSATITGLEVATEYTFTVTALDAAGNESLPSVELTVSTVDLTPPSVPLNVAGDLETETSFSVSWDASIDNVGVSEYDVLVNGEVAATAVTTSTEITGLPPGTDHTVTVMARDAAGNESAESSGIVISTLEDTEAPDAPANLTELAVTATSVQVGWDEPADNVGVDNYVVYQGGTIALVVTENQATLTDLNPETSYTITVSARDATGNESDPSDPLDVTTSSTPDTQAPTVPQNLTEIEVTPTTAEISWEAANDNVAVTGYIVYLNGSPQETITGTTYIFTGLSPETTYSLTVAATDAAGNTSAESVALEVTTPAVDLVEPSVPLNLTEGTITSTSINFSWDASTDNVGVTVYVVYLDDSENANVTGTTHTLEGLTPETEYSITVAAGDAAGNLSDPSMALVVSTLPAPDNDPPTAPQNLAAENVTHNMATLSWEAATDNVAVTEYVIFVDNLETATTAGTTYILTGLTPETDYTIEVAARDAAGNESARSSEVQISTLTPPDTEAPTTPGNLEVTEVTTTTIGIGWSSSNDNVGVTGYIVYLDATEVATVNITTYLFEGLNPSTDYEIYLEAVDAAGNRSVATPVVALSTLADIDAPDAPTGLQSIGSTESSITLSWTEPADNVGVVAYRIYSGSQVGSTTSTSFSVSGLEPSTSYPFYVTALDAAGNESNPSNNIAASTLAEPDTQPPTNPSGLQASTITESSVNLSWNASTDNVGVTQYMIYRNGSQIGTTTSLNYTASALASGTTYTFFVLASDAAGNISGQSNAISVTTIIPVDTEQPTAPVNLRTTAKTQTSISLTWSASTDNVGVTHYLIYQNGSLLGSTSGLSYTSSGLSPGTTYTIYVAASDAAGNISLRSNVLTVNTISDQDLIPPSAPTGLTILDITPSSISMIWVAATDNIDVVGYRVYINNEFIAQTEDLNYLASGLIPATSYQIYITALDAAGNESAASEILSIKTVDPGPDIVAPTAPGNLFASDSTDVSITLMWLASYDLFGVTNYRVYMDELLTVITTDTVTTISNLNPETAYTFYVVASDRAGNISSMSDEVVVHTTAPNLVDHNYTPDLYIEVLPDAEYLRIRVLNVSKSAMFRIVDMTGRVLLSRMMQPGEEWITIDQHPAHGIYVIQLITDEGVIAKPVRLD